MSNELQLNLPPGNLPKMNDYPWGQLPIWEPFLEPLRRWEANLLQEGLHKVRVDLDNQGSRKAPP